MSLPQNTFQRYQEAFLRLIYPARCGACQLFLELEENRVCGTCLMALTKLKLDFEHICLETSFEQIDQAWALYPYQSPLKEILGGIKFYSRRGLLKIFAADLEGLGVLLAAEQIYDAIVPIPLDSRRLMERQFNQSELIAEILARTLKRPVMKILKKRYPTPSQSGLHRKERLLNLHYAFDALRSVEGKSILLVDDVLTTGATAEEAARVLKEKGARRVDLAVLACNSRDAEPEENFSQLYNSPNSVGYSFS